MKLLIDSNVISDVLWADKTWLSWSYEQLLHWLPLGQCGIDPIVYAEVSARCESRDQLDAFLTSFDILIAQPSRRALHLAGKAHIAYRKAGGSRALILPDFLIGANATDLGVPLLTRDTARYRSYFPDLELIAP
jgi:predicted nucleic acid-binding protein